MSERNSPWAWLASVLLAAWCAIASAQSEPMAKPPTIADATAAKSGTRLWTDASGQHTVQAEFVEFKDGKAFLKRQEGVVIGVPIEILSTANQEWIRQVAEGGAGQAPERKSPPDGAEQAGRAVWPDGVRAAHGLSDATPVRNIGLLVLWSASAPDFACHEPLDGASQWLDDPWTMPAEERNVFALQVIEKAVVSAVQCCGLSCSRLAVAKGVKPREGLSPESGWDGLLLVRVHLLASGVFDTASGQPLKSAVVIAHADAALFRRTDWAPLLRAGGLDASVVKAESQDSQSVTSRSDYALAGAVGTMRILDRTLLCTLQQAWQAKDIQQKAEAVRKRASEDLPRPVQSAFSNAGRALLELTAEAPDKTVTLLVTGPWSRRWTIAAGTFAHVSLEPGTLTAALAERTGGEIKCYAGPLTIQGGRAYSYSFGRGQIATPDSVPGETSPRISGPKVRVDPRLSPGSYLLADTAPSELNEPWQRDWKEFGKTVAQTMTAAAAGGKKVDEVFAGRPVQWIGSVKALHAPVTKSASAAFRAPQVTLAMDPIEFQVDGQSVVVDEFDLTPTEEQWQGWAAVPAGAKVVFQTKFKLASGFPVVAFLTAANGPDAGRPFLRTQTDGSQLVRVVTAETPDSKPATPPALNSEATPAKSQEQTPAEPKN
ncbi:MAG: SHD1 domain-containing protein [Planctomycetota bacterium]|nr:SHD1 domain-containing protein [Planctomycetota bacterium]